MSLKAAKQLYTKKNSINRFIEHVHTLLADQSVSAERLEEAKGGLNAAWEVFNTAYDRIVEIQIEDETQAADKEEKDEEQGSLEASVLNLQYDLTETIAHRTQDQEVQRQQHKKLDEDWERLKQVPVQQLHLAGLYGEAKESLNQLLGQLSLEEPPSAEWSVAGEYRLVSARFVMEKAEQLSLEIATVKPDIAKELTDAHAAEGSSYDKMELEILTKVNKFKSLYPELQSPAADHASGTSRATGDNMKAGAFRFEQRTLPKFGGLLRGVPHLQEGLGQPGCTNIL